MQKTHTCSTCNNTFLTPEKCNRSLFCPHCHIQLFVVSTYKIQNKNTPQLSFQKEIIHALSNSFLWALLAIPIYYFLEKCGLLQIINENFNQSVMIFLVIAVSFIAWDTFKTTKSDKSDKIYTSGVDTLSDYQEDSCDYKVIRDEPLHKFKCENCHSYRMVDLFWYKRILSKTEKSISKIDISEEDFAGCLKCHTKYEIHQAKNNNKKELVLYLLAFTFPIMLFFIYQSVLKQLLQVELYKSLAVYFFYMWAYIFLHRLIKINTKDNRPALRKRI